MTALKPPSGVSIQTAAQLQRSHRRPDHRRQHVDRILATMQAGAALHLHYQNGRAVWSLTSGQFVPADVANIVITMSEIVGVGDSLFAETPAQTWRWTDQEGEPHA